MSLLEKVKQQKEEAAIKQNPLAKKPNPLAKKPNPLLVKGKEEVVKEEVVKEEVEVTKEEIVEEKEVEKTTEKVKETTEEVEKTTEEVKEEEIPKSKTKRKSKASEEQPIDIPTTKISYVEAINCITSSFVDEEWDKLKEELTEEISKVHITNDMNPGTMKLAIEELSLIREKIYLPLQQLKALRDNLANKEPEGLIERIKRLNVGTGNNDMERKKAGIIACMSYEANGEKMNLFEVLDETRIRFSFLNSIMESIDYKTRVLITMSSALKLEQSHL